jgi:hypothetical protein
MVAFQVQPLIPGRLFDLGSGCGTVQGFGSSRSDHPCNFTSAGSFLGFVAEGVSQIETLSGNNVLQAGSYFTARERCIIWGGTGFVIEIRDRDIPDLFGTARWDRRIAGGRSTVLIPPSARVPRGGPCLSAVFLAVGAVFEPRSSVTPVVGLVAAGAGLCEHDQGTAAVRAGQVFMMARAKYSFQAVSPAGLMLAVYEPHAACGLSRFGAAVAGADARPSAGIGALAAV